MSSSIHQIPGGKERALAVLAERTDRSGPVRPGMSEPCWMWTRGTTAAGYGTYKIQGVQVYAHRTSYEAHVGPVPEGLVVRHACDTPQCANPAHLTVGTHGDNAHDRDDRGRNANLGKTHCPENHLYDDENTVITGDGRRNCRTCQRAASRDWWRNNHGKGAGA